MYTFPNRPEKAASCIDPPPDDGLNISVIVLFWIPCLVSFSCTLLRCRHATKMYLDAVKSSKTCRGEMGEEIIGVV